MPKKSVAEYRELMQSHLIELTTIDATHTANIKHISDALDSINDLLSKQNGRIRKNENAITRVVAIGSTVSAIFVGAFGFLIALFNKWRL